MIKEKGIGQYALSGHHPETTLGKVKKVLNQTAQKILPQFSAQAPKPSVSGVGF